MFEHEIVKVNQNELPFKVIVHKNESAFIRRHWHRSFELSFTYQGQISEFIINGHTYHPKSGDILIVNSNEIHSIQGGRKKNEDNVALTILLPYSFMENTVDDFSHRYYKIPEKESFSKLQLENYQLLKKIFTELIFISEQTDPFSKSHIMSLVYEIVYLLTSSFSEIREARTDLYTIVSEFDWIDEVLSYIRKNLQENLSIGQLAKQFHLNENYFSRKFKKYMDMAVMEYITEIRLHQAYQLLTNYSISIQSISDQCGFPNSKSFTTVFKKRYGMTPRDYRKKMKES